MYIVSCLFFQLLLSSLIVCFNSDFFSSHLNAKRQQTKMNTGSFQIFTDFQSCGDDARDYVEKLGIFQ